MPPQSGADGFPPCMVGATLAVALAPTCQVKNLGISLYLLLVIY